MDNDFSWRDKPSFISKELLISEVAKKKSLKVKPIPISYSSKYKKKLLDSFYKNNKK